MRHTILLAAALGGLALSGCGGTSLLGKFQEYQEKGESHAAKGLSEVVIYRCGTMTLEQRKGLAMKVDADLAAKGSPARTKALDCDGDGASDF